jgi:hypothetical protein
MKNILVTFLIVVLSFAAFGDIANSQTAANPNNDSPYFFRGATPTNNYVWRGKIDTLSLVKLGAASELSYVVKSTDTMKAHIYIDYLMRGRSTWSLAYTDSFIAVKDTVFETILRSSTIDRIAGFASALRARISQHAAATPSDYDSTSTYTFTWIWKP